MEDLFFVPHICRAKSDFSTATSSSFFPLLSIQTSSVVCVGGGRGVPIECIFFTLPRPPRASSTLRWFLVYFSSPPSSISFRSPPSRSFKSSGTKANTRPDRCDAGVAVAPEILSPIDYEQRSHLITVGIKNHDRGPVTQSSVHQLRIFSRRSDWRKGSDCVAGKLGKTR